MKKTQFDINKLDEMFGITDIRGIVNCILSRFDENCEDYVEELLNCIDDELIYTEDEWKVIAYYSIPLKPDDISTACGKLFDDICSCIKEI